MLTKLTIRNFKLFEKVEIELGDFHVPDRLLGRAGIDRHARS